MPGMVSYGIRSVGVLHKAHVSRAGASGNGLFGASRSPGLRSSRQVNRSSLHPACGNPAKSKPKILRIAPLYHESKGASDDARSSSARSGSNASRQTTATPPPLGFGTSHTDSADTPRRLRDSTYSSSSRLAYESSCISRRQGSSWSAETSQANSSALLPAVATTTTGARHPRVPSFVSGANLHNLGRLSVAIPRGNPVQSERERHKPAPLTARRSHHSSGA
jgi:hypothetical protein